MALQQSALDLVAIVDDTGVGRRFLGYRIQPLDILGQLEYDKVLITTEDPYEKVVEHLKKYGVKREKICYLQ